MQAMVVPWLFMAVYVGWPGKVHGARVLVNSCWYQKGKSGTLLPAWRKNICRVDVCYIVMQHTFVILGTFGNSLWSGLSFPAVAYEAIS